MTRWYFTPDEDANKEAMAFEPGKPSRRIWRKVLALIDVASIDTLRV